jgi:hypothetical protein
LNELNKFFCTADNNNYLSDIKTDMTTENYMNYNTLTMAITQTHLQKYLDSEEIVNIKKLEKGVRTIFVPHSPGVYTAIHLSMTTTGTMQNATNFDSNYEVNKFFKCNAILNIDSFDAELKELLW